MMKNVDYDPEADAIAVKVGREKSYVTAELTEHILVDFDYKERVVGVEILDASAELEKIFGRLVSKKEIQQLMVSIIQKPHNEYLLQFKSPKRNQVATLLFPVYESPIIAGRS